MSAMLQTEEALYPLPKWEQTAEPKPARARQIAPRVSLAALLGVLFALGMFLSLQNANGSAPLPALRQEATPALQKTVLLKEVHSERNAGYVLLSGTLQNQGVATGKTIEVIAELLDAQGKPIAIESALVPPQTLALQAHSPFSVLVEDNAKATGYRILFREFQGKPLN